MCVFVVVCDGGCDAVAADDSDDAAADGDDHDDDTDNNDSGWYINHSSVLTTLLSFLHYLRSFHKPMHFFASEFFIVVAYDPTLVCYLYLSLCL